MRLLWVLRHAESSRGDPRGQDFDRPLTPGGRSDARAAGAFLKDRGAAFDLVLASPAVRVRQTIDCLAEGFASPLDPVFRDSIYTASAETLLKESQAVGEQVESVLIVGHNPGLHELVVRLVVPDPGELRAALADGFPSGALAQIGLPDGWRGLRWGSCRLLELVRPGDLRAR